MIRLNHIDVWPGLMFYFDHSDESDNDYHVISSHYSYGPWVKFELRNLWMVISKERMEDRPLDGAWRFLLLGSDGTLKWYERSPLGPLSVVYDPCREQREKDRYCPALMDKLNLA